uniref:Uncharacterized protein n=1 Tax=Anguilla anguilla TaxID=7936 RepID=A0A0E9RDF5_ANGAN
MRGSKQQKSTELNMACACVILVCKMTMWLFALKQNASMPVNLWTYHLCIATPQPYIHTLI